MGYLKRAEIKTEATVDQFYALVEEDIKNLFLDEDKKQLKEASCQRIACPVCGSEKFDKVYEKRWFTYGRCAGCQFFYVNPRPTHEAIVNYYGKAKANRFFQEKIIEPTIDVRLERIFKPRLELLNQIYPQKGKLLDVGCSIGLFLELAKKDGWEPYGVEFSDVAVEACKQKGVKVSTLPIEQSDFPDNYFDVISLWEVLEHVIAPDKVIEGCFKRLRPSGKLIITVPNIAAIEFQVLGKEHTNISAPIHLNYFSPDQLAAFLKSKGFKIESVETPGQMDVDNIRTGLKKGQIKSTGSLFLDNLFLDDASSGELRRELFQEFIRKAKLSGHLRVIARKP